MDETKYGVYQVMRYINIEKDKISNIRNINIDIDRSAIETIWFQIYQSYQDMFNRSGLVDFNELLKRAYMLCLNCPDILRYCQQRFTNILVDEFQDTNKVQYAWLRLLSGEKNNLMIVGDDDQSIYGWRGAQVKIFNDF